MAAPSVAFGAVQQVTYAEHVAGLLNAECVGCHRPAGSAPFSLTSYEDARTRAERIAAVTRERTMPPWLPDSHGEFVDERRLTDDQIELLSRWAADGAPGGDLSATPAGPVHGSGWELGEPDQVVDFPTYALGVEGRDVFRNLVAGVSIEEPRYVAAVEIRPGAATVVHHAVLTIDTTPSSRRIDAQDSVPGYDGMDLRGNVRSPDGHFLGWTPGRTAREPAEDLAWRLEPGTDLVLQLHMRPSDSPQQIEAKVGLHFTDRRPRKRPVQLVLESALIDIPPGAADYRVTTHYQLPVGVDVLSVYPHAHYLGKELRGFATLPDGKVRQLVRIPSWDFNWQDAYRFERPVRLPAGTVLTLNFTFDNSARNPNNPSDPPRRVGYGLNSMDEMAQLIFQVLPDDAEDRQRLVDHLARHHEAQSMTFAAARETRLGDDRLAQGDPDAAIRHFRQALRYRIDESGALVGLSRAFLATDELEAARLAGERAVESTRRADPRALAALAEAYAGLEDERAAPTAQEALQKARRTGDTALVDSLEARLAGIR